MKPSGTLLADRKTHELAEVHPSRSRVGRNIWTRILDSVAFRLDLAAEALKGIRLNRRMVVAGAGNARDIATWTTQREMFALYSLAAACQRGAVGLEVGSYLGASTCYIAAGLSSCDGRLICVDTWQNDAVADGRRNTFNEFRRNVTAFGKRISILRKRSDQVSARGFAK